MDNTNEFLERCNRLMQGQHPTDILRRARERISDSDKWTVMAPARNAQGQWRKPHEPDACRWDIQGAIAIECNPHGILPPFFMQLLDTMVSVYGCDSVGTFNDAYSHEMVLQIMEEAAKICEDMEL